MNCLGTGRVQQCMAIAATMTLSRSKSFCPGCGLKLFITNVQMSPCALCGCFAAVACLSVAIQASSLLLGTVTLRGARTNRRRLASVRSHDTEATQITACSGKPVTSPTQMRAPVWRWLIIYMLLQYESQPFGGRLNAYPAIICRAPSLCCHTAATGAGARRGDNRSPPLLNGE